MLALTVFFGVAFAVYLGSVLQRNGFHYLAVACYLMGAIFALYMSTLF